MGRNYRQEKDIEYTEKLRDILVDMPDFCNTFFTGKGLKISPSTKLAYAGDIRNFFIYLLEKNPQIKAKGKVELSDIDNLTVFDIEEYMSYVQAYRKDGKIITNDIQGSKRKLSALSSLFKYLFSRGMIKSNPAAGVETKKIEKKDIVYLTMDEASNLIENIENGNIVTSNHQKAYLEKSQLRDATIITVFLGTGMRVSELVGLDIQDIDIKNYEIFIRRKGGKEKRLPVSEEVMQSVEDYIEYRKLIETDEDNKNALFLSNRNTRITIRSVERLVKKYASSVTGKKITPHKLRSTHGTNLYLQTGDIYLVSDRLSHESIQTTKDHYTAQTDANRERATSLKFKK